MLLVTWPFAAVTFPPIADLPQHLAQVRLFGEALEPGSPYRIQWLTPYSLAYLPLAAAQGLTDPITAGRLGAAVLTAFWVGGAHLLAWKRRRPASTAVLASLLVFNHTLYWGFLPFLVGFPLFCIWWLMVVRDPSARSSWSRGALFAGAALLLYMAHALWFAAALAWLALDALRRLQEGWADRGAVVRSLLPRFAGSASVAVLAVLWFGFLLRSGFSRPPLWLPGWWWQRWLPESWVEAGFGGLTGRLEPVALALLVAWGGLALWQNRRRLAHRADAALALAGALFLVAYLVLPDKFTNTIEFNDRWLPVALVLLLLAAPPLRLRRVLAHASALVVLATFVTLTAATWQRVESRELAGLDEALAALPAEPRVLGLDYVRRSRWLDRTPFLQTFAWAQVVRGGSLNFSFAEFEPSPVILRERGEPRWTPGLEWYPQLLRTGDLGWFDHALVNAPAEIQSSLEGHPFLTPVTGELPWRLYRVAPDAPRTRFEPPTGRPSPPVDDPQHGGSP